MADKPGKCYVRYRTYAHTWLGRFFPVLRLSPPSSHRRHSPHLCLRSITSSIRVLCIGARATASELRPDPRSRSSSPISLFTLLFPFLRLSHNVSRRHHPLRDRIQPRNPRSRPRIRIRTVCQPRPRPRIVLVLVVLVLALHAPLVVAWAWAVAKTPSASASLRSATSSFRPPFHPVIGSSRVRTGVLSFRPPTD